jgi:phosphoribosylformylglycinamidine cyclo-ligase
MYRTFNMGMGYAFVLPESGVDSVLKVYPDASVVGTIVEGSGIRLDGIAVH